MAWEGSVKVVEGLLTCMACIISYRRHTLRTLACLDALSIRLSANLQRLRGVQNLRLPIFERKRQAESTSASSSN